MNRQLSFIDFILLATPILLQGVTQGWEVGSIGGLLAMPQFNKYFNYPSPFRQGSMTAALIAGELGGSMFTGFLTADRFGRKKTIYLGGVVYIIGQVLVIAAQNQAMFIVGRVVNGLGAGALITTIPLYTTEIAPVHVRGRLGGNLNSGTALGLFLTYWVQYGTAKLSGTAAWRLPLALQLLPVLVILPLMVFRPESPRWLVTQDRNEEALEALAKLRGHNDINDLEVAAELAEIQVIIDYDKRLEPPSLFALVSSRQDRRRTYLGVGLLFLHELAGVNICLYYAPKVFSQAGVSDTQASLLANAINGALLLVTTSVLMWFADDLGRRTQMIFGPLCMGTCFIVVGALLKSYGNPHFDNVTQAVTFTFHDKAASRAAIAFMYLYMCSFGLLYACVGQTYPQEIFSLRARGRGTALAFASNWLVNFWLGLYIPTALNQASWRIYLIFAAICYFNMTICYLLFPETARRTLEEIDTLFTPERTVWVFMDKKARSKEQLLHGDLSDGTKVADQLRDMLKKGSSKALDDAEAADSSGAKEISVTHDEHAT
ncbi:general substrate transporter [Trichoderma camerunense]